MPQFLIQVAYTPEAWAAMIDTPQNRKELVAPALESLGGKFLHAWMAFGEYDLVGIVETPNNVDVAAFSIAIASKGAVKALHTTPLLTMDEGVAAMKRAQQVAYKAPAQAAGVR
jgi:uncharacterized protein with GYD domain